ncbi:MAG: type II toxin-antitoxin system RelE/ParE family toxin, partial [Chloroflexota bacterium]
ILDHLDRLRTFPLSAPKVTEEGYEGFHQLIVSTYRIIYKFDQDEDLIKIYIVIDVRRQLPDPEYLRFQLF